MSGHLTSVGDNPLPQHCLSNTPHPVTMTLSRCSRTRSCNGQECTQFAQPLLWS